MSDDRNSGPVSTALTLVMSATVVVHLGGHTRRAHAPGPVLPCLGQWQDPLATLRRRSVIFLPHAIHNDQPVTEATGLHSGGRHSVWTEGER